MKKRYGILLIIAALVFVGSGVYLVQDYLTTKTDRENLAALVKLAQVKDIQTDDGANVAEATLAPSIRIGAKEERKEESRDESQGESGIESASVNDELADILQTYLSSSAALARTPIESVSLEIVRADQGEDESSADEAATVPTVTDTVAEVTTAPDNTVAGSATLTPSQQPLEATPPPAATETATERAAAPDNTVAGNATLSPSQQPLEATPPPTVPETATEVTAAPDNIVAGNATLVPTQQPIKTTPPPNGAVSFRVLVNGQEVALDADEAVNQEIALLLESYLAQAEQEATVPEVIEFEVKATPAPILPQYRALHEQNPDMVGWIDIAGTNVNAPVMQTKDDSQFYLTNNFDKEYSRVGLPFVDSRCNLEKQSTNVLVYGHNYKGGEMFSHLVRYNTKEFFRKTPTFTFNLLNETRVYGVIAVFRSRQYDDRYKGFEYYEYIDLSEQSRFNEYITQVKKLSIYETGETAQWGDQIVTLSTCSYHVEDGRFVVVAKRIE